MNPSGLKYSEEHEWVRMDPEGVGTVGITQFAVDELGDVIFLDLPEAGADISQFERFGEIESVKAVSELYSPVSGKVIERNELLMESPELVNQSPYETGWLLKIEVTDSSAIDRLMSPEQYDAYITSSA